MKKRKLFVITLAVLALLSAGLYYGWQVMEVEKKLQQKIHGYITTAFGDEVTVEDVRLRLGTLRLKGVVYQPQGRSFSLHIREISLGYSLASFIKGGMKLEKTGNDIIFTEPVLMLTSSPQDSTTSPSFDPELISEIQTQYKKIVRSAGFLEKISISNGKVLYTGTLGTRFIADTTLTMLRGINGWLETRENQKIVARLAGIPFTSDEYSAMIKAGGDLSSGAIDSLVVELKDYDFSRMLPIFQPEYIEARGGVFSGKIRFSENEDGTGYELTGKLEMHDGRMKVRDANLDFSDINLTVLLDNFDLHIERGEYRLNGSPFILTGDVRNIFKPETYLYSESVQLDIESFLRRVYPKISIPLSGTGTVAISFLDSLGVPSLSGAFRADKVVIAGKRELKDVAFLLEFSNSLLSIQQVHAHNQSLSLEGFGTMNFTRKPYSVDAVLVANGNFLDIIQPALPFSSPRRTGGLTAKVTGPLASPRVDGTFSMDLNDPGAEKRRLLGKIVLESRRLDFSARATTLPVAVNGRIDDVFSNPEYDLHITHAGHLARLLGIGYPERLQETYHLETAVSGVQDSVALDIIVRDKKTDRPELSLVFMAIKESDQPRRYSLDGNIFLQPGRENGLAVAFQGSKTDSSIQFTRIGNRYWLDGELRVALVDDRSISGELRLSGVDIGELLEKAGNRKRKAGGVLAGRVKLDGTVDTPRLTAEAWLINGMFNGIGRFNGELALQADKDSLVINKAALLYNEKPYAALSGGMRFSPFDIDLELQADKLDANELLVAITGQDSIVGGEMSIDARFKGASWPVPVYGSLRANKGNVLWFLFDEFIVDFGVPGSRAEPSLFSFAGLKAASVSYISNDQYMLQGSGYFPFNGKDSLRLVLEGEGNFLADLHYLTDVVLQSSSYGRLRLGLQGPYDAIRLFDSELEMHDGRVRLAEVTDWIEDITATIHTEDDFIAIDHMSGRIGDEEISVRNYRNAPVVVGELGRPLVVDEDWMSLGTLQVNSGPKGLPLNIPGIMPKGDVGRFTIQGMRVATEDGQAEYEAGFWVGGPWRRPVFRGSVVMNNVNISYPFEVSDEPVNPLLDYILLYGYWDVLAIAGRDNRYVTNITSGIGIDKVYINIGIDDQVSELHFLGVLGRPDEIWSKQQVEIDSLIFGKAESSTVAAANGDIPVRVNGVEQDSNAYAFWVKQLADQQEDAGPDTSSFRIIGKVESTRGTIEYLDLNFRVDKFSAEWDKSSLDPVVSGKAWTTVPDSTRQYVYLKSYARDPATGEFSSRGRLENTYFKLESENPAYNSSQMQVLSLLGYTADKASRVRMQDMITVGTENLLIRPLLRPVERSLERSLGLDMVRLNSRLTRNFLLMNQAADPDLRLALLNSTQLTVGKYLSSRMFLLYTGQITTLDKTYQLPENTLGLRHTLGLEYRFNPALLLQIGLDYNPLLTQEKDDKNILLRYSFPIK